MPWLRPLLFAICATTSVASTFTWTGAGGNNRYDNPANWSGGAVPPGDGTATVIFGAQGAGIVQLPLFGLLSFASVQFPSAAGYTFDGLALINVNDGFSAAGEGRVRFAPGILVNLAGSAQTMSIAGGSLEISGALIGGARLDKTGAGTLVLSGLNLYTGGTQVDAGSVSFANPLAVPPVGRIGAAANAYVGITYDDFVQATFLDRLDLKTFTGAIGLDTAAGQSASTVFGEQLDLSSLTGIAGLGSQTSARVTGQIKVAQGADYRFGGGAGTLVVESNLTARGENVQLRSAFGTPLTLVLRGNNSFGGQLNVLHSVLVLDSAHALPGASSPGAQRRLNLTGPGYAGSTENFVGAPADFLGRLGAIGSPQAIVGFDSAQPLTAPRTVSDAIDLSEGGARTDPYYLGTSTRVTITGEITPTVGDSLYLTAVKGGHLTVASHLGAAIPSVVVGQANSFDPQGGTVELRGDNAYNGGTQILGGTLIAGGNASLGRGGVSVGEGATLSVASSVLLRNSLTLARGSTLAGTGTLATPGGTLVPGGARISPAGILEVGTLSFNTGLTLGSGGVFAFNLLDPLGAPGAGWDLLNVVGSPLTLTASAANPFRIDLITLSDNGVAGPVSIFDATQSYTWTFATASKINGFSADQFAVNASGFLNATGGGSFIVTQTGAGLALTFTPVPEPSTYALLAFGLGLVIFWEMRRRR
jgi:autotransporter-associated beta strand protein